MDNDLTKHPPRRWNDTFEGIAWLPRLIDKARAYDAGTLGSYLFGQSPVDNSFLAAAGISYDDILNATRLASDDAGVLTEIDRIAPGATDRLRQWSANPPAICRASFTLADADEGHANGFSRVLSIIPQPLYAGYIAVWRRLQPLRLKGTP
jgi:hypothetical protein